MKMRKFAITIEKSYEEDGSTFIQGVASGTIEDREDERMSVDVIKQFVQAINDAVMKGSPMKLTNGHARGGPVGADLGEIVYANMLDDGANSLFIKAKLDTENPFVPYLVKQVNDGKHFAFSIEGSKPVVQQTWSEKLGKFINEFKSIVPKAISVTSQPSYSPSFMEFVTKSYDYYENILVKNDDFMEKETKVEAVAETIETPVIAETPVEEKAEETVAEVEAVAEPIVSEEAPVVETEDAEKSVKEDEIVEKGMEEVEVLEEISEAIEEKKEEIIEDMEASKIEELCMKVDMLISIVNQLVESDKAVHEEFGKSVSETENVLKSFHDDIEVLKDMPLQKKSKVGLVEKSFEDRKEEEVTNPFRKAVEAFVQ